MIISMKKLIVGILAFISVSVFLLPWYEAKATMTALDCEEIVCITKVTPTEGDIIGVTNETKVIVDFILPEGSNIDVSKTSVIIDGRNQSYSVQNSQLIVNETGLSGIGNLIIKVEVKLFEVNGNSDTKTWTFYTENSEAPMQRDNLLQAAFFGISDEQYFPILIIFGVCLIFSLTVIILVVIFLIRKKKIKQSV
jgi:hypothetical protein